MPSGKTSAFTLLELLCVIAIIGILAGLLLPVLSKAQARAKRIQCVNQLHQAGVAFHNFAHDHNGIFPMQVPVDSGGSREYLQNAYLLTGDFYFAFGHFQALSAELVTPKVVLCPADVRLPAANFIVLSNENLSYFVSAKADLAKPSTILAGDRNVTNDWRANGASLKTALDQRLHWTSGLHVFKGNLLYSDGHVEQLSTLNSPPAAESQDGPSPVPPSEGSPAAKSFPQATHNTGAGGTTKEPKPDSGRYKSSPPPTYLDSSAVLIWAVGQTLAAGKSTTSTNSVTPPRHPEPKDDTTEVTPPKRSFAFLAQQSVSVYAWVIWLFALLLLLLALLLSLELRRRIKAARAEANRLRTPCKR